MFVLVCDVRELVRDARTDGKLPKILCDLTAVVTGTPCEGK